MGHITKLKINYNVGTFAKVEELEGSIASWEMQDLMKALNSSEPEQLDQSPPSPETAQVPRSSMESDGEVTVERLQHWQRQAEGLWADMDAARGAVRILSDALGIESGDESNIAKLAKQVHARVGAMSDQYWGMDAELENLRGAMHRIQMPDVPVRDKSMELPKQAQELAHHMDVLKRTGFSVVPEPVREGVHVHGPQSREERLEALKKVQQDATRMMIDLATLDGFVKRDTPPEQIMERTMVWSIEQDRIRKEDALKSKPEPGKLDDPLIVALMHAISKEVTKAPTVASVEVAAELSTPGDGEPVVEDSGEPDRDDLDGGEDASPKD